MRLFLHKRSIFLLPLSRWAPIITDLESTLTLNSKLGRHVCGWKDGDGWVVKFRSIMLLLLDTSKFKVVVVKKGVHVTSAAGRIIFPGFLGRFSVFTS